MYREVVARAKELYGLDPSAPEVIEAQFQNKKNYSFKIYFSHIFLTNLFENLYTQ